MRLPLLLLEVVSAALAWHGGVVLPAARVQQSRPPLELSQSCQAAGTRHKAMPWTWELQGACLPVNCHLT